MENSKLFLEGAPTVQISSAPRKRFDPVLICAAVILSASLICHGWLLSHLISLVPEGNLGELLVSHLLPNYTFAEREISLQFYEAEPLPPKKEDITSDDYVIRDLSAKVENGFALSNQTSYSPDLSGLYKAPSPIQKRDKLYERYLEGEPLVLVYHTHATESYSDTNDTGSFRTSDPSRSVVSVGEVFCQTLERAGIPSVHMTELFDGESYNDAYYNSSSAVAEFLKEHPSVQYVIDLHRDCIMTEDDKFVSASFTDAKTGEDFAQLMFVVGTDEGGSSHTEWEDNLTVALHIQKELHGKYPSLMRPVNLRSASFYQHTSPGAMLLEFGSCGNTLDEAKRSAVLFALELADYVIGEPTGLDPYAIIEEIC